MHRHLLKVHLFMNVKHIKGLDVSAVLLIQQAFSVFWGGFFILR